MREKTKQLSKGDRVLVHLPEEYRGAQHQISKYHNKEMTISRKKMMVKLSAPYYELEGAVSDHWDLPFSFCAEWLTLL